MPDASLVTYPVREVPRIVWMLWLQGWDKAPPVAQASRASWDRVSGWEVRALDAKTLTDHLSAAELDRILNGGYEMESISNLIRFGLLFRHGGVWADATTLCVQPLDSWLPAAAPTGFFAFAAPGPNRPLSTWFLASAPRHRIVADWRTASLGYWVGRETRHTYFWCHGLFADLLEFNPGFRRAWLSVPKVSARHAFHFGPSNPRLLAPAPADLEQQLATPPVPVFKLTHKGMEGASGDSLFQALCRFARGEPQPSDG